MRPALRAALAWFLVFVGSVVFAVVTPTSWQRYTLADETTDAAFNLIGTAIVVIAIVGYFVKQRDRFQQRSDDLLHNILPDAIVVRLKDGAGTIADDVPSASVLFADVADFTPMSATISPGQLVGLLDEVFSAFDRFVDELGLEKIKTIGDAYMVASGVPVPREDHADAIVELAIRIRDHVADHDVRRPSAPDADRDRVRAGHRGDHRDAQVRLRPVGRHGEHGEPHGVERHPGKIQLAPSTYELIRERYACESRGSVQVKGKAPMTTYLVLGRRQER